MDRRPYDARMSPNEHTAQDEEHTDREVHAASMEERVGRRRPRGVGRVAEPVPGSGSYLASRCGAGCSGIATLPGRLLRGRGASAGAAYIAATTCRLDGHPSRDYGSQPLDVSASSDLPLTRSTIQVRPGRHPELAHATSGFLLIPPVVLRDDPRHDLSDRSIPRSPMRAQSFLATAVYAMPRRPSGAASSRSRPTPLGAGRAAAVWAKPSGIARRYLLRHARHRLEPGTSRSSTACRCTAATSSSRSPG